MERETLKRIVTDTANEEDILNFDTHQESFQQDVSAGFTDQVLNRLQRGSSKIGIHVWGIVLGVITVLVLWGLGGFVTPEIALNYEVLNIGDVELTEITQVFMMGNALLLLLVIDRIVQRKKKVA